MNFNAMLGQVPSRAKFIDDEYYIWGASMVRDKAGLCHLFYSRWPHKLGHSAWVTHSEIAHAMAADPLGPYEHADVTLPPRGAEYWDGLCTHNPTVLAVDGKIYLYYMGNTGDGQAMAGLNWGHRNNQRIGVAVADHPNGPWTRFDVPLIDVSPEPDAHDALMVSNPSVCRRPDGGFLMVYKCVAKRLPPPAYGPVVHMVATAPTPTGPFTKHATPVFTAPDANFPAEDPSIWVQDGEYWAIVKDMQGSFTGAGKSLALFHATDGLTWELAPHPLVSRLQVDWQDHGVQAVNSLERPQLWLEDGKPAVLFCAVDEDESRQHSFNVHIPLQGLSK